jgi:hypothetical protein
VFLITGAGRSGSTYITRVLKRCGLDVGHHKMGKDGIVCGFYCFDAKRYPTGNPAPRPKFDVILHQVRDPLKTIASVTTGNSRGWARQFVRVEHSASPLRWACYYWLTWNLEAERQALWTYRIENLKGVWPDLQRVLCFDKDYDSAIFNVPLNVNTRQHDSITWQDAKLAAPEIYGDIREAAKRYGY